MKIKTRPSNARRQCPRRGFLLVDLIVGLAILTTAVVPLGYSFARERQALKIEYYRGVIDEIVDGEMEILAAGGARNLPDGMQNLPVASPAAARLPAGHFQLAKSGDHLEVGWTPDEKCGLSAISRETTLK